MKIRSFKGSDVERIDEIWREHHSTDFSLPNRNNAVIDAVIENDEGEIVAYGQVKLFAEAMFVLDKTQSRRIKVEALKLLMLEAFRGMDEAGLEDLYMFIKQPEFASLMSKHFSFEIVDQPGELLLRKV